MYLLSESAGAAHALQGSAAEYLWVLPLLPLLGFVLNGLLAVLGVAKMGPADPSAGHGHGHGHGGHDAHGTHDHHGAHGHDDGHDHGGHHPARHRFAGLVSIIGPGVLLASFGLAVAIFAAMRGAGELYEQAIREEPKNFRARNNYAAFLERTKDSTVARRELLKAAALIDHPLIRQNLDQLGEQQP